MFKYLEIVSTSNGRKMKDIQTDEANKATRALLRLVVMKTKIFKKCKTLIFSKKKKNCYH